MGKAVKDVALYAVQLFRVPAKLGRLAGPECFGLLKVGQVRGQLPVSVVLATGRDHGADKRGQLQDRARRISPKRGVIAMG